MNKLTTDDILAIRLQNQMLSGRKTKDGSDLVKWLGAVQSQDFSGAKWGLANRITKSTDKKIQKDFDDGEFLRTHVMRPTWHFVHPDDISWMLDLTSERIKKMMRTYDRDFGVEEKDVNKSKEIVGNALESNGSMTRAEISEILTSKGIKWGGNGLSHILMYLELDKVVISGDVKGKSQTYSLFSNKARLIKLEREEAISELAKRYFLSHGPATVKDFAWWSGLKMLEARLGIEINKFEELEVEGKSYFWKPIEVPKLQESVYLLPNYDEYGIAYTERSAFFDDKFKSFLDTRGQAIFQHLVIYNGRLIGTWKRTLKAKTVEVNFLFFEKQTQKVLDLVEKESQEYAEFLDLDYKTSFN